MRPILEYGTPVWSPFLMSDIGKLEKVQRSFTRRLPGMGDLSYLERLERVELESLEARRIRFDLLEAFKIIKGISCLRFDDFFEYKNDYLTRGHRLQLRLKSIPRLEIRKKIFANRVVKIWNDLPPSVVEATTIESFKRLVSSEFLRRFCRQNL